jgi:hypothetical protein
MQISETTMKYHLIPVRMAVVKETKIATAGENTRKEELLFC